MAVDTVGRGRPVWSLLLANANQNSKIARKGGLRREHKGVTTNKGISVKNNNFKPAFRVGAQRQRAFPWLFLPAERGPSSSKSFSTAYSRYRVDIALEIEQWAEWAALARAACSDPFPISSQEIYFPFSAAQSWILPSCSCLPRERRPADNGRCVET